MTWAEFFLWASKHQSRTARGMTRIWGLRHGIPRRNDIGDQEFLDLMDDMAHSYLLQLGRERDEKIFQEILKEAHEFLNNVAQFGYEKGILDGIYSRSNRLPPLPS